MHRLRDTGLPRLTALLVLLPLVLLACAAASGRSEADAQRIGHYGVTAILPAGWSPVPIRDLPGAKVPLEAASFKPNGAVRTICRPPLIVAQIPPGGALVQILDDGGFGGSRKHAAGAVSSGTLSTYPPLPRSFRLGQPQSYECGEAYNIFFRRAGRAFQLRIWTAPGGASEPVRRRIEAMMDSLRVRGI